MDCGNGGHDRRVTPHLPRQGVGRRRGWSGRKQESEADVIGLRYMAEAGFDPRQAVPLWQNMTAQRDGEEPAEFTSTHPSSERRIEDLINQWSETLPIYNAALEAGRQPNCVVPLKLVQYYEREKAAKAKAAEKAAAGE